MRKYLIATYVALGFAFVLGLALSPFEPVAWAKGHIGWRDMNPAPRTRTQTYTLGNFNAATTSLVDGVGGVIVAVAVPTGASPAPVVEDNDIATFMAPQRVYVVLSDDGGTDTLTCASVEIGGYDQFGNKQLETILTIDETGEYSLTVFERVTSLRGVTCVDGVDATPSANDRLRLEARNRHIGLRIPISSENDIVSLCMDDASASFVQNCATLNDGGAADVQSALNLSKACGPSGLDRCYTIDLATANLFAAVALAAQDVVRVTFRPFF